jgi:hypothetical protein
VSFDPLAKSHVNQEILLHLKSGNHVRLPVVDEEEGAIFTVLRFIVDARRVNLRE